MGGHLEGRASGGIAQVRDRSTLSPKGRNTYAAPRTRADRAWRMEIPRKL